MGSAVVLFVRLGSLVEALAPSTRAVLRTSPGVVALTRIETVTDAPLLSVPRLQVTFPGPPGVGPVHAPAVLVAEMNPRPDGRASTAATPNA